MTENIDAVTAIAERIDGDLRESIKDMHPSARNALAAFLNKKVEAFALQIEQHPERAANELVAAAIGGMLAVQMECLRENDLAIESTDEEDAAQMEPALLLLNQMMILPGTLNMTAEDRDVALADPEAFIDQTRERLNREPVPSLSSDSDAPIGMYL